MFKRIFFATVIFLLSSLPFFAQDNDESGIKEPEVTVITINNARQSSYKKDEESGNDCIILEGSVSLTVEKGSTSNEIKADKIVYDRKTEMLYADGNVEIIMKSGSGGKNSASATSLIMNTSTLEGIFDDGKIVQQQSDALNLPSGSTLIVFSEMFGKGNENVITFKNSSLTFCDEDPPHWHINATRTWLLPGGEFAFFNGLLYVGVVPILYFPAFYYPKDELIFNPVFDYKKRTGYSVQTTTYLWGRKPLNNSSSSSSSSSSSDNSSAESLKAVYNFVKPSSLKDQVREGLVLHNLDTDYTGDSSHYVKFMADWYSNLGYLVGFDGVLNPLPSYISKLNFNAYLGFSKTIFKQSDSNLTYYPHSPNGVTYRDDSSFLGLKMPFRYAANVAFELSKPFRFSLSLPVYSDPFFSYDYITNRKETMDWISYLLDTASLASNTKQDSSSSNEVSSYSWKISASYSPTIPSFLKPYISSLSLSLNSSVSISSRSTVFSYSEGGQTVYTYDTDAYESAWTTYTPTRRFYYPSLVTPITLGVTTSGTIFSWPKKETATTTPSYIITLNRPDELKTEKQLEEERKKAEEEAKKQAEKESGKTETSEPKKEEKETTEDEKSEAFKYYLPELEYTAVKETVNDGISYNLSYNVGFNMTTQMAYSDKNLRTSNDFNWNNIRSSMYNIKLPLSLTSLFNYGGNFFSVENKLSFSPVFQQHSYIAVNDEYGYTETEAKKIRLSDMSSETRDLINTNSIVFKPLLYNSIFSDSSLSWNSTIKLYRRNYNGDSENPDWDEHFLDWSDEDCITVNSLAANINAKEFNNKFTQSLRFEMVMPPLKKKYTASLTLGVPYASASVSTGFEEVRTSTSSTTSTSTTQTDPNKQWKKSPLAQTLTLKLFDSKLQISESFTYNLEDNNPDSLKISASMFGLQLSYLQSYVLGYDFNSLTGWKIREEKQFLPYSFSLSYTLPAKTYYRWFNRVSFAIGINTSIVADLLRPTNSYFTFVPSIKFKIHEFCEITFSASIKNSILYWYFHNDDGDLYSEWGGFPGNILKDLIDSFRFDDEEKRRNSGFKLKSINMSVTHDLHDWKASMTMKIEPRIITQNGKKMYDFKPYITIGVVWNPMESMKTKIVDEYGEWKLE